MRELALFIYLGLNRAGRMKMMDAGGVRGCESSSVRASEMGAKQRIHVLSALYIQIVAVNPGNVAFDSYRAMQVAHSSCWPVQSRDEP
jgi:hypothetical protein